MNRPTANKPFSAGGPIANVIVVLVTVLAIGAFVVLGVFAAVALGGIILVLAAVLGIRMWWLDRKRRKSGMTNEAERERPTDSTVIEGEYQVVSSDQDERTPD